MRRENLLTEQLRAVLPGPGLSPDADDVLRRTEMIHSRVHISDLREHVGGTVSVCGWVNTLRLQRKMQFVIVRDSTGMAQVTHRRDDGPLEAQLEALTPESAVRITGRLVDAEVRDGPSGDSQRVRRCHRLRAERRIERREAFIDLGVHSEQRFDRSTQIQIGAAECR